MAMNEGQRAWTEWAGKTLREQIEEHPFYQERGKAMGWVEDQRLVQEELREQEPCSECYGTGCRHIDYSGTDPKTGKFHSFDPIMVDDPCEYCGGEGTEP